jgi:hypothetical protein
LAHDIVNKPVKGDDAASTLAPAKQFGAMNIKGSEISPGAASGVFMFHFHRHVRLGRIGGMTTSARLDAGFLIGRQNEFIILKGAPIP